MPSNVEIKAYLRDVKGILKTSADFCTEGPDILCQEDVVFNFDKGRLKLRKTEVLSLFGMIDGSNLPRVIEMLSFHKWSAADRVKRQNISITSGKLTHFPYQRYGRTHFFRNNDPVVFHTYMMLEVDYQLKMVISDLFAAGGESTSTMIRWSILFLVRNKNVQEKMYKEIESVVGHGRLPNMSDKPKLPYIEAVILESMRLGNIIPFGVPYHVTEDFFYNGYRFPKDAVVFSSIDSALLSDKLFPKSSEFDPERFIDKDGNLHKQENILVFSAGRRMCPDEPLAKMELFLYMASLVQRFEFLEPLGEDLPSLKGHLGITYTPLPYKVRAIPRYCT